MSSILCIYYSRSGITAKLMEHIAARLDCECVALSDGVDRSGLFGWLRCGMDAMARKIPMVSAPDTALPLEEYDLVIIGTPVWAGRCSSPVRSFLLQFGEQLKEAAYVITRGSDNRYEDVFDQMDLYVKTPHTKALTIRPNTVGCTFWQEEFLSSILNSGEEKQND